MILALSASYAVPSHAAGPPADTAPVELRLVGPGSIQAHAYPSLAMALDAARRARAEGSRSRIEIRIGAGVARVSRPLEIGADLSGTPTAPTVIAAEPGVRPELRAARQLVVSWRPYRDGLWIADAVGEDFDQLWVNDKRQVLARYPNYDPTIRPLGGYAADVLSPAHAARWSHPEDGVVRAIHASGWGGVVFRIEGRRADGVVRLGEPLGNNRVATPMNQPHPRFRFVEGLLEELDAPGEWYFDRRSRRLFYFPPPGVDLSSARIEVSAATSILRLVGDRANPVHDVEIEGLSFSRAKDTILDAKEPLLRSDWRIARDGAVFIAGAEAISIRNSDFHDLGGQALFVSGYNRRIVIEGDAFWDIGGSAISFVGLPSAVRSAQFDYDAALPLDQLDRTPGPASPDYPAASTATDNLIHDIGRSDKQAAGVEISMSQDITVSYSTIYDVPRAGINIGDGTWGGHVIAHNDVFDTVLETGDHGAFNAWGRDRYWRADRKAMDAAIANEPTLPTLDAVEPNVLRNNRFQSDHGWDIDLDDGASNYEIYDNVLASGGLKLREGFRRKVFNNIIIDNSLHPHVWFKDSSDSFERNIVMGPYRPVLMEHWPQAIDHNLFPDRDALDAAHRLGLDAGSMAGDPQFVDADHADYRVWPSSPALVLGFHNFPMTFGVRSPRLRALARRPGAPRLVADHADTASTGIVVFGATVKSVETLGEQSAAGLPEIAGVLVLAVKAETPASEAGLAPGDVILRLIRRVDGGPSNDDVLIRTAPDLASAIQVQRGHTPIRLEIQRNQTLKRLEITP